MLLGVLRQNKLYLKKFIAKIFTQLQKSKYIINHTTLASKSPRVNQFSYRQF